MQCDNIYKNVTEYNAYITLHSIYATSCEMYTASETYS